MFVDQTLSTLKAMPEFLAAETRAAEQLVAERKRHIAEIARIDAAATKAWPGEEKRKGDAIAKLRQAERDLKAASEAMNAVANAVAGERLARENARRQHEAALNAGVDWSAIDAFLAEAQDETVRTQKAGVTVERLVRNQVTGRIDRVFASNGRSVKARLEAILESARKAPSLRVELADPRELPAELERLKSTWPPIEDVTAAPNAGAA